MKLLDLASNNSFWRGIDYHKEKCVVSWEKIDEDCYHGKVKGSNGAVYDVTIDIAHPRRSVCNCPFAEGRRVICKHMVALDLGIFPEKERQYMKYIEDQNQLYEEEYEKETEMRREEIRKHVMSLSKKELQEALIQRMINELCD